MTIPGYEWLAAEQGPKILIEMLKLYGVKETPGAKNNPVIMGWAKELGVAYPADAVAWCGLGVAIAAHRAGYPAKPNGNPLWARNWADWGTPQKVAMLGDVLVFPRGKGGHVGLYVGETGDSYHVLGANQSDAVNIRLRKKEPIIAIRRSPFSIGQPANVGVRKLKAGGTPISSKED